MQKPGKDRIAEALSELTTILGSYKEGSDYADLWRQSCLEELVLQIFISVRHGDYSFFEIEPDPFMPLKPLVNQLAGTPAGTQVREWIEVLYTIKEAFDWAVRLNTGKAELEQEPSQAICAFLAARPGTAVRVEVITKALPQHEPKSVRLALETLTQMGTVYRCRMHYDDRSVIYYQLTDKIGGSDGDV